MNIGAVCWICEQPIEPGESALPSLTYENLWCHERCAAAKLKARYGNVEHLVCDDTPILKAMGREICPE